MNALLIRVQRVVSGSMCAATTVAFACGSAAPAGGGAAPALGAQADRHASLAFTHVRVFGGERTLPDTTVLVDGDQIVAVEPGLEAPTSAEVIDGRGKTLLPGLIDAHVHVYQGKPALEQALAFGVTTVLDMFTEPSQVKALRADPLPDHADLRSSGMLATAPSGHGTEYGVEVPTLTGPEQAQAWVDARIAEGSDYIKIVFDDGRAIKYPMPTLDTPTFAAVVNAAHHRGKLAVVHIGDYDHAQLAIDNGADGLVHLFRDRVPEPGFGARVAAHRAFVTPTLVQSQVAYGGRSQLDHDPLVTPYLGPEALDSLGTVLPHFAVGEPGVVAAAIAQLRDAGASILCGSDAPNPGTTFGASLHEELALLVGAGLSPTAALTAATAATAARFGLTDRGRIAVGLRADLVLVDGDPTTEIARTRHISGIWRGGRRFDRDGYRRRIATIAAPVAARAPAGELGLVSDFENGPTARFGSSWTMSTTGASKAAVSVGAGAHGSSGALEISGDLVPGGGLAWAGALWKPGTKYWAPVDLSGKPGFSFLARGDGKPYAVLVFTRHGRMIPSIQSFQPGREFGPVRFTWSQFDGMNGSDVIAIGIVQTTIAGSFQLAIDDLTLQ